MLASAPVAQTVRVEIEKCTPIGLAPQTARFLVQVQAKHQTNQNKK